MKITESTNSNSVKKGINYDSIDLANQYHSLSVEDIISGGAMLNKEASAGLLSVSYQNVLRRTNVPGVWKHTIGGDIVDLNVIGTFLSKKEVKPDDGVFVAFDPVVDNILQLLKDEVTLAKVLGAVFFERNGTVKTGSASITFEMMRHYIVQHNPKFSGDSSYLLAMLLNPIRTGLKLNAPSSVMSTFELKEKMFPTMEEMITTFQVEEYISILEEVDYSFVDAVADKSNVSIGFLASSLNQAFSKIFFKMNKISRIHNDYMTVLALIKAHLSKNYDAFKVEQRVIFEDPRFLSLCNIMTLGQHALSQPDVKPLIGDNYWMMAIENISSMISSTSRFELVDLNTIKELYTVSHIHSSGNFRKGVVISRNIEDKSQFEPFRVRKVTEECTTIFEDNFIKQWLGGLYNSVSKLSSDVIHKYVTDALETTVTNGSEYFAYTIGIQSEEVEILSYLLATRRFIIRDPKTGFYSMVFEYTTDGSLIDADVAVFMGRGLTRDPRILLLYGQSHKGSNYVSTHDTEIFKNHQNSLFLTSSLEKVLDQGLKGSHKINMKQFRSNNSGNYSIKLDLKQMIEIYGIDEVRFRTPIIGNKIITSLFQVRDHLAKVLFTHIDKREEIVQALKEVGDAAEDKLRQDYLARGSKTGPSKIQVQNAREAAHQEIYNSVMYQNVTYRGLDYLDAALMKILKPIVEMPEIEDMTKTFISRIWISNPSLHAVRLSDSFLTTKDVELEMKLRVAFFMVTQLGFLDDHKSYAGVLKRFNEADLYKRTML